MPQALALVPRSWCNAGTRQEPSLVCQVLRTVGRGWIAVWSAQGSGKDTFMLGKNPLGALPP